MVKNLLDVEDVVEYLKETGNKEDHDIYFVGMMNNNLAARLSDRLTNIKGITSDGDDDTNDSFDTEKDLLEKLLYHTMIIKDRTKDVMRRREWGTDDNDIKKLARQVLLIKEGAYLQLLPALNYFEQTTKDIPELKKLFENSASDDLKALYQRKKDNDLGFG